MQIEDLIKREEKDLASYAMLSSKSKGRVFKEASKDDRLPFQKDRDRVIHSKAFRRLEGKTQVFIAGTADHYRTRLTHSIEVSQVSRDIARSLDLNEDLAETIALAHDLGHPPFAHAGQEILNEIMQGFGMHFEHNEQSRRIVEKLEKMYPEFDGLNLTAEVIEGLNKHHTPYDQPKINFTLWPHLEAQIVNLADEIAYTNHDIDDGVRSGVISHDQLRNLTLWQRALQQTEKKHGKIDDEDMRHYRTVSSLHSMMIGDLCSQSLKNFQQHNIKDLEDVRSFDAVLVSFSDEFRVRLSELRKFLYENFYLSDVVADQFNKAQEVMQKVFNYYLKNLDKLPQRYKDLLEEGDQKEVVVKDYIAGMTDGFILEEYKKA